MSSPGRPRASRILHQLDRLTSRDATAAFVGAAVVLFLVGLGVAGFPDSWQIGFATLAAAATLVMVFVIQHTQSREQAATQLKLDELIRALPQADDRFVRVEAGSDTELVELEQRHFEHHEAVREDEQE